MKSTLYEEVEGGLEDGFGLVAVERGLRHGSNEYSFETNCQGKPVLFFSLPELRASLSLFSETRRETGIYGKTGRKEGLGGREILPIFPSSCPLSQGPQNFTLFAPPPVERHVKVGFAQR